MKKVFLTLAVVVTMVLSMSKITDASIARYTCVLYINEQCNYTALVCGETLEDMVAEAEFWNVVMDC